MDAEKVRRMTNARYKVGVIGPARSVERILSHVAEHESNMTFIGYSYGVAYETSDILEEHHEEIDFWLFSGYIPYLVAQESKYFIKDRAEYIFITDNTFYRGLLEKCLEVGKLVNNVSVDILDVQEKHYVNMYKNLEKQLENIYIKQFSTTTSIDEIVDYHMALWNAKKIDVVITVYPAVEERLERMGVPVYWTGPLKQDIFHTLQIFIERIQTFYYKDTQTTALVVQVKNYDKIKMANRDSYNIQYLQLEMKRIILQICEKIDGYLIEESNGRFVLFSSRGIVERNINTLFEMADRLSIEADQPVIIGIGNAATVYYAENYAHHALQPLLERDTNGIVVMQEDGTIKELSQTHSQLRYSSLTHDIKMIERLQQTSVSAKVFTKIEAVLNELKIETFSTKILAKELNMTDRNAQRIISELVKAKLIEFCGEENRNTRGRPAKLYRFSDELLL